MVLLHETKNRPTAIVDSVIGGIDPAPQVLRC